MRNFLAACGLVALGFLGFFAVPGASAPPPCRGHHSCPTTSTTTQTTTTTSTSTTTPTTTAPPTTTTPPTGTVLFDGRAKLMTSLSRTDKTDPVQVPALWSCLCFTNNDISLIPDNTYGKAYNAAIPTGDTNPWGGSSTSDGAGQLSVERPNDLGKWDFFAIAVKVNAWNGPMTDLFFTTLASFGYQTSQSDQVGLGLWGHENNSDPLSFEIHSNAGFADNPTGFARGTTSYKDTFLPVTFGRWEDFVIAIKWTTGTDGEVIVYNRHAGSSWTKMFDKTNIATYLYGTTQYGTFAQDGSNWSTVLDKIGLYFQEYGGESEAVQESGLTRCSDLATAQAVFP